MAGLSLSVVLLLTAVILGCIITLDSVPPSFDPLVLTAIVNQLHEHQRLSPLPLNDTLSLLQLELQRAYPGLIHPSSHWLFNLAGGFKTGILLLHASLTEYVAVWGSAVDTTGHSGRNMATFSDWLIAGNGTWWHEGGLDVAQHVPPAYVFTERWAGRIVHLQAGTWMLEHCHGVIPVLLPFGLADGLLSSLDPLLVWKSVRRSDTHSARAALALLMDSHRVLTVGPSSLVLRGCVEQVRLADDAIADAGEAMMSPFQRPHRAHLHRAALAAMSFTPAPRYLTDRLTQRRRPCALFALGRSKSEGS